MGVKRATQSEIARALRAAKDAGGKWAVRIDGTVIELRPVEGNLTVPLDPADPDAFRRRLEGIGGERKRRGDSVSH